MTTMVVKDGPGGRLLRDKRGEFLTDPNNRKHSYKLNGLPRLAERTLSKEEKDWLETPLLQLARQTERERSEN